MFKFTQFFGNPTHNALGILSFQCMFKLHNLLIRICTEMLYDLHRGLLLVESPDYNTKQNCWLLLLF